MKVFRVEVMVLDCDGVGEDGVRSLIENTTYPNHAIAPRVAEIESRDVDWNDGHPLNRMYGWLEAFRNLFRGD